MQESNKNNESKLKHIWNWFSLDKILIFLFFTVLGWAAFMKITPEFGAILIIIGCCSGLIWMLRRQWIRNALTNVSEGVHPKMPVILSILIVCLFVGIMRFSPLWGLLVEYTTPPDTSNPYYQLIRTVTATVKVSVVSKEDINTTFMNNGGYLAFGKGTDALLITSATSSIGRQIGGDTVVYSGVFNMDATSNASQQKILFLKQAEYIQISFSAMPARMLVISGQAIVIINDSIRLEFPVPNQIMSGDFIIIPNIQKHMPDFNE